MTTANSGTENKGAKARILIMDDEVYILNIARKMLKSFGYDVTLAMNGEEAISAYRNSLGEGRPYDLVILDLTIPNGMGGDEVAQKILTLDSGACLAISSGYSDAPIMMDPKAHGLKGVIPKPYRLAELKETVQNLIS